MLSFHTIKNSYILASTYFAPSRENGWRIASLIGSLVVNIFQAKYDKAMRSHIYKAFDFFRDKRPIEEFHPLFRSAVVQGLASVIVMDMASGLLKESAVLSFQNAMMSQTLNRWLDKENYQGLNAIDCKTSQNISRVLAERIPQFTSTSIGFVIERTKDLALALFSLHRIYHLSKPLVSKSLPFPLNCPGGVFAVMIGMLGLFSWIKVKSQEGIAHSHGALDRQKTEVLNRITFLERNALQVAAFPPKYKDNILNDIQVKATTTLASVHSVAMNSLFNVRLTYMFPQAFELFVVYLASLFAKADPDHFDYAKSFLPLIRESLTFMWRTTHLIQMTLDGLLGYSQSMREIHEFLEKLSTCENQKKDVAKHFQTGASFSIQSLTSKIQKKDNEPLFSQLNLQTEPGHMYFVCGINGCGKTVFLKTIAGFQPCAQGTLTVPEHVWYLQPTIEIEPADEPFDHLLSKTFGIQDPQEVETVKTHLKKFQLYYPDDQWKIPQVDKGEYNWASLSDGEKQILNLAAVLTMMETVKTPWLILADEILSQVDNIAPDVGKPSTRQVALHLLKQLAQKASHTILIVDHNDSGMQRSGENLVKPHQAGTFKIYKQDCLYSH